MSVIAVRFFVVVMLLSCISPLAHAQNEREQKVAEDKHHFDSKSDWLYNDLTAAYRQSRDTGKPILAVLRCIPCEECVKLDDDLIDNDPAIAPLMSQFIRLRLTMTNGLDLKTFQYDTDQSFAIFFLNADKVVYGRFGTRSHRSEWVQDVSVEGMARAMEGALALHKQYPANRDSLRGKTNQPVEFDTPERFPTLTKKPGSLNWEGRDFAKGVVKNCIHCHEISEARMEYYWNQKKPIPQKWLYPYPHPKSVGLILDPRHRAKVERIVDGSAAERAGLAAGDEILRMNGQPLISMADVQWVLHHLSVEGADVELLVSRKGELSKKVMRLESGWREADDTSWRTGHWILRRSMLGGMKLIPRDDGQRGIKVGYIGNWGPFGVAKRAGVQKDDVIVSVDGKTGFERESDVLDYVNTSKKAGQDLQLKLLRNGRGVSARYKIQ